MKREDIKPEYKWKIEDIFSSDSEFYSLYNELKKKISFKEFKGKLNNAETIKNCYDKLYALVLDLEILSVYAMMKRDEDGSNSKANEMYGLVEEISVLFSSSISFIDAEITSLSIEKLTEISNSTILKDYYRDIKRLIDYKPHILGEEAENLLALGGKVFGGYKTAFSMIDNVDLDCPTIKVDNKKVKVTGAVFSVMLQNPDRNIRRKAFKSYYKAYEKVLNTITALYLGNVDKNVFITKARKFKSSIERALFAEEVDKSVYENLLKSVNNSLSNLHEYIFARRDLMGGKINMYDLYVPLVKGADLKLDYKEAYDLVIEGLKPLGEDYKNLLKRAYNERWIDVYENEGKRGGAYSVSVYGLKHPFVLWNHTKTTHSVFTIAHEMGHAIHSFKSNEAQKQQTADYKIFVAEVASTVNEILLIKHLTSTCKSDSDKKYFLSYYLDTIRTTLFRQTMFAEFEYNAHKMVENGKPLTKDYLCKMYYKLNKKYYGKGVIHDKEISYEWARIPHFYNAFYVYKYSTGIISAICIAENILKYGEPYVKDYFKFLSSGSTDTPVELLKIAGVDLTKDEPYKIAMQSFSEALNEFKKL